MPDEFSRFLRNAGSWALYGYGNFIVRERGLGAVVGIKSLLLQGLGENLEAQWAAEKDYTTHVMRGAKAEDAFPDFIARKGRG